MTKIRLEEVHFMPKVLEQGVLYVTYEYGTAAHLCACGCGSKIRTPIGPTAWQVYQTPDGPSLWPSVGNWQQACKSHYVIDRGDIRWANQWSEQQILDGRKKEEKKRKAYYEALHKKDEHIKEKIRHWFDKFFN